MRVACSTSDEDERWWEHTDEYRDLLLQAMETAWTDLSPIVDEWTGQGLVEI